MFSAAVRSVQVVSRWSSRDAFASIAKCTTSISQGQTRLRHLMSRPFSSSGTRTREQWGLQPQHFSRVVSSGHTPEEIWLSRDKSIVAHLPPPPTPYSGPYPLTNIRMLFTHFTRLKVAAFPWLIMNLPLRLRG